MSSGAIRRVTDPSTLEEDLLAGSGKDGNTVYAQTKFVQLLGAHWWRRKLKDAACKVVAVSPGLIPGTGIGRGSGLVLSMEMQDAKSVDEGEFPVLYVSIGFAIDWTLSAYMWPMVCIYVPREAPWRGMHGGSDSYESITNSGK